MRSTTDAVLAGAGRFVPALPLATLVCRVAHHVAHPQRCAAYRRAARSAIVPDLTTTVGAQGAGRSRSIRAGRAKGGKERKQVVHIDGARSI